MNLMKTLSFESYLKGADRIQEHGSAEKGAQTYSECKPRTSLEPDSNSDNTSAMNSVPNLGFGLMENCSWDERQAPSGPRLRMTHFLLL